MMAELRLAKLELLSTGTAHQPGTPRQRNLGGAIFLVAIDDYRSLDEEIHQSAKQFLYPTTAACQDHFDWAVALANGLNPGWLRDALDRARGNWDRQRAARIRSRGPSSRQLRMRRKANELKRCKTEVAGRMDGVAV